MKLHNKLSLALLTGLLLVVATAQFLQYRQAGKLIAELSESTIQAIRSREESFAQNIFNSVEHAVAGSLERGEMEKFTRLIETQKSVEGLLEFSLFDIEGFISHTSNPQSLKTPIPEDVSAALSKPGEVLLRYGEGVIEIYRSQEVVGDCIRCHITWELGSVGGVTSMKFSTEALVGAEKQAEQVLGQAKRTFLVNSLLTLGGIVVLFLVTMHYSVSTFIRRPLDRISAGLKDLSEGEGELNRRLEVVSKDELGTLAGYFNTFLEKLQAMVGQIQRSGIQVTSSSTELAATARQHEATLKSQLESTFRVSTSVNNISSVARQLVGTVREVTAMSQEAAQYANSGQADLSRMGKAMSEMEIASKSISGRLETINEKTENITTVVTTITKVADQTNLLSLNAAIEAEKAGEFGRGFIVVAREIRRLADQTAIATLDIEQMVKEMQAAVTNGVREMDTFIDLVRHNVDDVGKISAQLNRIIEQVRALSPNFETVNTAMGLQSDNAQKINNEMVTLSEEMQQIIESLHDSFLAIGQLNEAAKGLQNEVCRFKVE
jgi:methyl-accepting chemotaxis protein